MKIKYETILDIYKHKNTTLLCQIKVQPSKDNKQQSQEWKNTCRCITQEQWNTFDKELKNLLEVLRDKWNDEIISTFSIKPNIEVKVQKSKLSSSNFYNIMGAVDDAVDDSGGTESIIDNIKKIRQITYVLEFILDFKPQPPSISPIEETQEYEPKPKMSPDNVLNSPLSYAPYTPSKKKYRANSLDTIKTPGVDFLGHESSEDAYLPKSISCTTSAKTDFSMAAYKPAPIKEKRFSKDSQKSNHSCNKNESIAETDEELLSPEIFRTIRSKVLRKKAKQEIEYIPKSQEIFNAPDYIPTPIEEKNAIKKDSLEHNKSNKDNNKNKKHFIEILKEDPTQLSKYWKKENFKNSHKEVRGRISKRLEYKEQLPSKSKGSNHDKVRIILERPETPSSEDDIDKPRIVDTNNTNELGVNMGIQNSQESSPEKVSILNITLSSATESAATDVSPPYKNTKEMLKKFTHHDNALLRRSARSPIKPKRLIEEQSSKGKSKKKFKTQKSSPINKELFGTDYEDDDDDKDFQQDNGDDNNNTATEIKPSILQTPKCEDPKMSSSSSSSSSTKKKRKRDKSSECEQEKRDILTWLGKKKSNSELGAANTSKEKSKSSKKVTSTKDTRKSHSKSESPQPAEFVMPTKEELENIRVKTKLQQEQNEKLKAELEKISAPPPKEVENLSLKDMSVSDLLDTFSDYKLVLDEIYEKNRKKDHIKSHNGINHCFVIRLMEPQTQYKMLQKLTDVYRNTNSTTQATLYANAMLPEWIIRIYMKKYKFTREQAMQQIKAQDAYQLHIDEQSDNSFMFD